MERGGKIIVEGRGRKKEKVKERGTALYHTKPDADLEAPSHPSAPHSPASLLCLCPTPTPSHPLRRPSPGPHWKRGPCHRAGEEVQQKTAVQPHPPLGMYIGDVVEAQAMVDIELE